MLGLPPRPTLLVYGLIGFSHAVMTSTHHEVAGGKGVQALHEKRDTLNSVESAQSSTGGYTNQQTKNLLGKLDRHILPWMAGLFLVCPPDSLNIRQLTDVVHWGQLSYLDRSNIGNARLDTLEKDLGMHGLQFNNALAIFYPFYVIAEVPSNIMLKRTRASLCVPTYEIWCY